MSSSNKLTAVLAAMALVCTTGCLLKFRKGNKAHAGGMAGTLSFVHSETGAPAAAVTGDEPIDVVLTLDRPLREVSQQNTIGSLVFQVEVDGHKPRLAKVVIPQSFDLRPLSIRLPFVAKLTDRHACGDAFTIALVLAGLEKGSHEINVRLRKPGNELKDWIAQGTFQLDLNGGKATLEKIVKLGEETVLDRRLMPAPVLRDRATEALVKNYLVAKIQWRPVQRVVLLSDWRVNKNYNGMPIDRKVVVSVGIAPSKGSQTCSFKTIELLQVFDGRGYSGTRVTAEYPDEKPIRCQNMNQ